MLKRALGFIVGVITAAIGVVTGNASLIVAGVTQVIGAIVYSVNEDVGTALMLIGGAVAVIGIPGIRKAAAGILQYVRGAASALTGIVERLSYYVNIGIEFVKDIVDDFNQYFNDLITSTIAPIFDKIRKYTETLSSIFAIAQTVGYIQDKKYLKAFYNLIQWIDAKSAADLETSLKYLDDSIKALLTTFTKTLSLTRTKVKELASDVTAISDVTRMIGEAFGVKEIVHLSKGLEQFRQDVLQETIKELGGFRREISDVVRTVTSPIYEITKHFRAVRRDDRIYNRFFASFIFSGFADPIILVHPPQKIPKLRWTR